MLPDDFGEPGFTPGKRHLPALFAALGESDKRRAGAAEKALARAGLAAAHAALERLESAEPPLRGRLVVLIAKIAGRTRDAALEQRLLELAADRDAKSRRAAIHGLGKIGGEAAERVLIAGFVDADLPEQRAIVEALGKIGGPAAKELLDSMRSEDAEVERLRRRALVMLTRTHARATARGAIELEHTLPHENRVILLCRRGLESIVADEARGLCRALPRGSGEVEIVWGGPLRPLLELRTVLEVAISVPLMPSARREDAVLRALLSGPSLSVLRAWTRGRARFRLAFASGHQRSLTWNIAALLSDQASELVNDPTDALWEVRVDDASDPARLLLVPRGAPDHRFDYRVEDVPGASHPTLAAALARVGGVRRDDVVWDPFVGSGLELVERARLGPYAKLFGSDTSQRALDAARANTRAARVARVSLAVADARSWTPPGVTLIVTNPPMGRRVVRSSELGSLLDAFIDNAPCALVPGGRMVWLTPAPERCFRRGSAAGFAVERRGPVDLGGFDAELQIMRKRR